MLRNWNGPLTYVISAVIAGLINAVSVSIVGGQVSSGVASDLDAVLVAFTSISLLAISMQFIYARGIGQGGRAPLLQGVLPSAIFSLGIFIASFLLINSTTQFRLWTSALVAIAGFFALIPSARLATLLINQKWQPICVAVVLAALSRMVLWSIPWFQAGMSKLLVGVVVSNILPLFYLFVSHREDDLRIVQPTPIRTQSVPLEILIGMTVVAGLASLSLKSKLGVHAAEYSEIAQRGRAIFFLALIVAYSSFPKLCAYPLFSKDLGRHFRQAQVLAVGLCGGASIFVISSKLVLGGEGTDVASMTFILGVAAWTAISLAIVPLFYYVAHNSRLGLAVYISAAMMLMSQFIATTTMALCLGLLASSLFLLAIVSVPAFLRSQTTVGATRVAAGGLAPLTSKSLTVIVPSYNSGSQGIATVQSIFDALSNEVADLRVIAVSDGSTDESCDLFDAFSEPWFTHIGLKENKGKGAALREGFLAVSTEVTAFIDADGDISPRLLSAMYQTFNVHEADVVFGSKWHPDSKLQVTWFRRALSNLHHTIQIVLFKLNIDDTQVGIKMYRTKSLMEVLPVLKEEGFSLDLEIFIALSAYGYRNFIEMPVEIVRTGESTISVRNVAKSFIDMLRIFWRARVTLNYDALAYSTVHDMTEIKQ